MVYSIIRYLHPADHYPVKLRQTDKILAGKLDLDDLKFSVKIKDIHKIKEKEFYRHKRF